MTLKEYFKERLMNALVEDKSIKIIGDSEGVRSFNPNTGENIEISKSGKVTKSNINAVIGQEPTTSTGAPLMPKLTPMEKSDSLVDILAKKLPKPLQNPRRYNPSYPIPQ